MMDSIFAQLPFVKEKYLETVGKDSSKNAGTISSKPYIMEKNKCLLLNHFNIFGNCYTDRM